MNLYNCKGCKKIQAGSKGMPCMNCGTRLREQNIIRKDIPMDSIVTFLGYCPKCTGHMECKEIPLRCLKCDKLHWIEAEEGEAEVMTSLMARTGTEWIPVDGHKGCSCSQGEHKEPVPTESLESNESISNKEL